MRHELYKHSRARWEQQTQCMPHRQGGQGGRKPKLATATLPQPHVGEQRTMCGRAGVKKWCNKQSSKAKARANE